MLHFVLVQTFRWCKPIFYQTTNQVGFLVACFFDLGWGNDCGMIEVMIVIVVMIVAIIVEMIVR